MSNIKLSYGHNLQLHGHMINLIMIVRRPEMHNDKTNGKYKK